MSSASTSSISNTTRLGDYSSAYLYQQRKIGNPEKTVTAFFHENEYKTPEQIRDLEKDFLPQVVGVISGYDLLSKE